MEFLIHLILMFLSLLYNNRTIFSGYFQPVTRCKRHSLLVAFCLIQITTITPCATTNRNGHSTEGKPRNHPNQWSTMTSRQRFRSTVSNRAGIFSTARALQPVAPVVSTLAGTLSPETGFSPTSGYLCKTKQNKRFHLHTADHHHRSSRPPALPPLVTPDSSSPRNAVQYPFVQHAREANPPELSGRPEQQRQRQPPDRGELPRRAAGPSTVGWLPRLCSAGQHLGDCFWIDVSSPVGLLCRPYTDNNT